MTPTIDPADVVAKVARNIRQEVDAFLAALIKADDAVLYMSNFISGYNAIVITNDQIRVLPLAPDYGPDDDPAEPPDDGTGNYL